MEVGEKHKSGFILNTAQFNKDDIFKLSQLIKSKFDLEVSIHSRGRLYIKASSKKNFISLITPYIHSSKLYLISD